MCHVVHHVQITALVLNCHRSCPHPALLTLSPCHLTPPHCRHLAPPPRCSRLAGPRHHHACLHRSSSVIRPVICLIICLVICPVVCPAVCPVICPVICPTVHPVVRASFILPFIPLFVPHSSCSSLSLLSAVCHPHSWPGTTLASCPHPSSKGRGGCGYCGLALGWKQSVGWNG